MPPLLLAIAALATLSCAWRVLSSLRVRMAAHGQQALEAELHTALDGLRGDLAQDGSCPVLEEVVEAALHVAVRHVDAADAELVFFTPQNRVVLASRLHRGEVEHLRERFPDHHRRLMEQWVQSGARAMHLRAGDVHPLRPWLRERDLADLVVVPLTRPDAHGVLVVGNRLHHERRYGTGDVAAVRVIARCTLEALLRLRHDAALQRMGGPGLSTDDRTGLPSSAVLAERLRPTESHGSSGFLASIRIAGVEAVAETHGRQVADAAVAEVCRRLLATVRHSDLLAHDEGDRLALVVEDVDDVRAAMTACERLLRQAIRPVIAGDVLVTLTASAGLAPWRRRSLVDGASVLQHARDASARAAREGASIHLHVEPHRVVVASDAEVTPIVERAGRGHRRPMQGAATISESGDRVASQ